MLSLSWGVSYALLCSLHQTSLSSHWMQTQQTGSSKCQKTTRGWHWWRRSSCILSIQKDLTAGSCCVKTHCLDAVTGRLSGREMSTWQWLWETPKGKETRMAAGLEGMNILGLCTALIGNTFSATIRKKNSYRSPAPFRPEWECMWTVQAAFCPSIQSPPTHWFTSTPSTLRSLNLFIQGLDLRQKHCLVLQCLCVLCRGKSLLVCSYSYSKVDRHWVASRHAKVTHVNQLEASPLPGHSNSSENKLLCPLWLVAGSGFIQPFWLYWMLSIDSFWFWNVCMQWIWCVRARENCACSATEKINKLLFLLTYPLSVVVFVK